MRLIIRRLKIRRWNTRARLPRGRGAAVRRGSARLMKLLKLRAIRHIKAGI